MINNDQIVLLIEKGRTAWSVALKKLMRYWNDQET